MLEAKLQKESRHIKINPLKLKDMINLDQAKTDASDMVFDNLDSLVRSKTQVNLEKQIKAEIPQCLIDFQK